MSDRRIVVPLLLLAACVEERPAAVADAASVQPITAVTGTNVVQAAAAVTTTVAAVEPEDVVEDVPEPAGGCKAEAPWTGAERCVSGDHAYAVGSVEGVREIGLARSTASDRARRALGNAEAEVIDFYRCGQTAYALARAPKGETASPACEAGIEKRSPVPKGCPEWTRGVAWHEGEGIAGVGAAKMRNTSLADAAAANRARSEIARMLAGEQHDGKTSAQGGYSELAREKASCNGTTYVKLVARAIEDEHH